MNRKNSLQLISTLSDANGPSGFEDEVIALGKEMAAEVASVSEDALRNLYLSRRENTGTRPVVMLDAHADEVGFMIRTILPNGTMRFMPLGGWSSYTVPAHKVRVRALDGSWISGIVASRPVHYMSAEERGKSPEIADMVIDIGVNSAEEAIAFGMAVGAPVVPDVSFEYNEKNGVMLGKAFDCRVGCSALLETMQELADEELSVDLTGVFTSQEEIGDRGVQVAVNTVHPDLAIVFEGAPADDTFLPEAEIQTGMGRGAMLRHIDVGMITNPRLMRYTLELARENGIPVQEAVRTGGRTNGAHINLSGQGVPTIVISVPVRYAHTHHGFASIADYESVVRLAAQLIRSLDEEIIGSF
jgi:putative aminopeptidase FrvX